MRPGIVIVNSSSFGKVFPEHVERLTKFADVSRLQVPIDIVAEDFIDKLRPFHGIIASVNPDFPRRVLRELPNLVVITRHGIGFNNVDVEAAEELGVPVTKVEGIVERAAVAEQAVALLMTVGRHIHKGDCAVRAGKWAERANYVGIELQNRAVGIVGLGNIGSRTSEILAFGFNSKVLACDPAVSADKMKTHGAQKGSLDEVLAGSEVISLHCSLTKDSYHMLGKREFAAMRKGVVIVNTARGEIIDEVALLEALEKGIVRYYAADVVEGEPIGAGHRLLKHPNVVVVPHLGGYTYESLRGMGETMVSNMEDVFVRGVVPGNIIRPGMKARGLRAWA